MSVKLCNVLTTLSFTHDPGFLPYSNYIIGIPLITVAKDKYIPQQLQHQKLTSVPAHPNYQPQY